MINGWKVCNIEELGTIARGRSKHRPRNDEVLFGGKYPFIQTADVKQTNLYIESYSSTYNDIGLKQSKLWPKGTLCITIAANIAETGILGIDACFPDSIVGFTPYPCTSDVRFVKYMIDMLKIYMQQISKGTTQDNLSLSKIAKIKFEVPNYEIQVKIADTLSMYDDLIANNNKRIKILEQMAENLYKEWFVRFRFPGYETAKFVDDLPKGWKVVKLHDYVDIKAGGDRPEICKDTPDDVCNVPIYSNGINNNGLYGYTTDAVIYKESITISARGTVGFVCLRRKPFVPIVRLLVLTPTNECFSAIYLYYLLKNDELIGNGTSQQQITIPMVQKKKVLKPALDVVSRFSTYVKEIWDEIDILQNQNQNLIKQRDYLLPRLMSGKLQVK